MRDNIRGPLSFFSNLSGASHVHTGSKRTKVNPGFFYVSNADQHYSLEINNSKTETLNIHFGDYWADQAFHALSSSLDKLLDEPVFSRPFHRVEMHNKLYEISPALQHLLHELQHSTDDRLREEEKVFEVLKHLLFEENKLRSIEAQLPVVKNSTRKEIFKRLAEATDYIYSNPSKEIALDDLASISCLSKFHFLRLFKTAFDKTPHQFINEVKVKQATSLLTSTKLEVKQISRDLGFKDSSTFSRLYFRETGLYPSQIR